MSRWLENQEKRGKLNILKVLKETMNRSSNVGVLVLCLVFVLFDDHVLMIWGKMHQNKYSVDESHRVNTDEGTGGGQELRLETKGLKPLMMMKPILITTISHHLLQALSSWRWRRRLCVPHARWWWLFQAEKKWCAMFSRTDGFIKKKKRCERIEGEDPLFNSTQITLCYPSIPDSDGSYGFVRKGERNENMGGGEEGRWRLQV